MTLRWVLASIHLLGLGVGLGSVWARARALQGRLDAAGVRRVFAADSWWGLSAVLLIGSGLWRLLGQLEKSTAYYLGNHVFWGKMTLLLTVLLLEILPMVTLIRWRGLARGGQTPDTSRAPLLARVSYLQTLLLILMVFAATAMARGVGT